MNEVPPHHPELLTMARALRQSAVVGDITNVHAELSRLRNALVHHLHAARDLARLRDTSARVAHQAQQRILALLDDLLFSAADDDGSCNCLVRAAEVEVILRRQATLEAALADHTHVTDHRQAGMEAALEVR